MPVAGLPLSDGSLFLLQFLVVPAWGMLMAAPRHKLTPRVLDATAAFFLTLWLLLLATAVVRHGVRFDFFSWDGVHRLMTTESVVLPMWMHTVIFDCWVGRWEAWDGGRRGVPQGVMAVPLMVTLWFGPLGLLTYLAGVRPFYPEPAGAKAD